MLNAHPDLAIPIETGFFPKVADRCATADDPRTAFLDVIRSHERWKSFQIDDLLLDQRVAQIEPFDLGAGLRVFYNMYADVKGKPRYGDKSPRHAYHMCAIQDVLPEARFIHIVRDGRDVALSVKDLSFGPSTIEDAAAWWTMLLWRARGQVESLRCYFELRYEDLVLQPEATLRQICNFIDLPWDPAMLRYHETWGDRKAESRLSRAPEDEPVRPTKGRTHFNELIGKPPQADRVAVWRREMALVDQERFAEIAGDMLEEFGYPLVDEVSTATVASPSWT